MRDLNEVLKFIERLCIEDKLYFKVPYLLMEGGVELTYSTTSRKWGVYFPNVEVSDTVLGKELTAYLALRYVDTEQFRIALEQTIMSQVAYANLLLSEARKLFGEDVVYQALADQECFRNELVAAVEGLLKPKPRLVKETQ